MKLKIKPLSVNKVWQGKRFKTQDYKMYEMVLKTMLPLNAFDKNMLLELHITFGFSSKASDIDNPVKPFLDVLQKKYGIDDKNIYYITLKKEIVKKGEEFIDFDLKPLDIENL